MFIASALLLDDALLKCVVTEAVSFSTAAFLVTDISKGSVATHLMCGGIFSDSIITNISWFWQWNKFENLSIFDEVKTYKTKCDSFFGPTCIYKQKVIYVMYYTLMSCHAVPRSTQPSTLRGTVNEYQPYGWVIVPVAMGECSAYSSLQADSKVKFAAWPASWRPPGADRLWPRWTAVNSRIWLAP